MISVALFVGSFILAALAYGWLCEAMGWRRSFREMGDRETEKLQAKIGFDAWEKMRQDRLKQLKTKKKK